MIFRTEADLCRDLIAAATAQGWVAYPETAGWDLILVWPGTGEQLGIEAKLRPSLKLVAQLEAHRYDEKGPKWLAGAMTTANAAFHSVAWGLGVLTLTPPWSGIWGTCQNLDRYRRGALDFLANSRLPADLPPAPPRVEAGARSPRRANRWKMAGLRTLARLEVRGSITAEELRELYAGNLPACWFGQGWLVRVGLGREGTRYALEPGGELPPHRWPAEQPEAYAEALVTERRLAAEAPK